MTLRLFVDQRLAAGAEVELPAAAARHVQVRRLQPGATLVLFDGRGGEWRSRVGRMKRHGVAVAIEQFDPVERELPVRVTIAIGMPANERMDWLVEKATELGAHGIQPLHLQRSVLRLAPERAERRQAHWRSLAVAACEQCGRNRVPWIGEVREFGDWLAALPPQAERWLLSPAAQRRGLPPLGAEAQVIVLAGPEGGPSADEERAAVAAGFVALSLGERTLRAETAPLAVLAALALRG
jgi:16S rRNA (uracil1498-N3)-methyltransferase